MDLTHWQPLIDWLHQHPHWIGWITCLIALSESLVVIGLIVPGAVMMVAIGTLVGADVIPFTSTMLYGALGAILGDGLSYWCGRHYHEHLRDLWPFRKYPQWLKKGEAFFQAHGAKSVFIGRFVGPVRPFVPVIAGMLNLSPLRFYMANFISAFIWSPAYMLPGIILGQASKEFGPEVATHFLLSVLALLLLIALSAWLFKWLIQRLASVVKTGLITAWAALQKNQRLQLIYRCCQNDHAPYEYQLLGILLGLSVLFVAFSLWAVAALNHLGFITTINDTFFYLLRSLRNPSWDKVMVAITLLGNSKTIVPLWLVVSLGFALKRHKHLLLSWLFVGGAMSVCIFSLKHGFFSSRPADIIHVRTTSSFPSAHTTLATVFYGVLATWVGLQCTSTYVRHLVAALACTLIALVALSRLYLGAHWFSDIVAALLLGSFLILLGVFLYLKKPHPPLSLSTLAASVVLGLCLIMPFQVHFKFQQFLYHHTPFWPSHSISTATWWQDDGRLLSLYLYSRTGKPLAPFNIQWVGDLQNISAHLKKQSWKVPPKMKIGHSLKHLNHNTEVTYQPFFTKLFQNQQPSLILIKYYEGESIPLMLQLWHANMQFTDNTQPLWIGTLHRTPPQRLFQKTYPVSNILDHPTSPLLKEFYSDLSPWIWKKKSRTLPNTLINQLRLNHKTMPILLIKPSDLKDNTKAHLSLSSSLCCGSQEQH